MLKKISLFLLTFSALILANVASIYAEDAATVKPTSEYVVDDYADILDEKTKEQVIDSEKVFKKTKMKPQVVVMTIKSTENDSIANWSDDLLMRDEWKFGKSGEDNGVLILFAQNNGKNNVRISTGYGVEDILTDQKTHDILESHVDDLKSKDNNKVNKGIRAVDHDVNQILLKKYADGESDDDDDSDEDYHLLIGLVIIGFVAIIALLSKINPNNHGGSGGGGGMFWSSNSDWRDSSSDSSWSDSWSDSGGGGDFGGGGSDI